MEEVQKPNNSGCHPPSSEPFRIYLYILMAWLLIKHNGNFCVHTFRDVTACGSVDRYQRFGRSPCLNVVAYLLKARTVKPEETAVDRE
jgi:hypothetical protein